MPSDTLHALLGNAWTVVLVILFFDGTIFIHELGHFVAARRCGVKVDSFSIGFGPAIWSRRGKDGVKYRFNLIPFGGYVLLPQLANLEGIEGKSETEASDLPPVGYGAKMLIFVAGAAFQMVFAFALACVVWVVGQPQNSELATTRIGYVSPTLDLPDGTSVPSPAAEAGLHAGDVIREIDHQKVSSWFDLKNDLAMSSGRGKQDQPRTVFTVDRAGTVFDVTAFPRVGGPDGLRQVGIMPASPLIVDEVAPGSPADKAGLKPADEIRQLDGAPVLNDVALLEGLYAGRARPIALQARRGGQDVVLTVAARPAATRDSDFGLGLSQPVILTHPSPWSQVRDQVALTLRTLGSLLNPHSDIGLSKLAGPIGIVHMLGDSTRAGLAAVLGFTILLNVNLAILNLLPIPILDGGHMLFATVGRIRGRALPVNFIVTTQSVFLVLIVSVFLYVSVFDVRRWRSDAQADRPAPAARP